MTHKLLILNCHFVIKNEVINMEEAKVGDEAKDFTLKDQNGNEIKLSDFKGKKALLSFHPLAWTSV